MASQASEIYRRAVTIVDFAPADGLAKMRDVLDQYERVASIAQSQLEFLQGVTEFYRARTDTKMTIAGEKLAVIAALTLPITAISSVMGMNVIVNGSTHWASADHPARPDARAGDAAAALGQAPGLVVSAPAGSACPCGSGLAYAACCEPLHDGQEAAATAERLMRLRYAAYARRPQRLRFRTCTPAPGRPTSRRSPACAGRVSPCSPSTAGDPTTPRETVEFAGRARRGGRAGRAP